MKLKDKLALPEGNQLLIDTAVLSVLSIILYVLPFASYTFKNITYTISGFEFITGKTILGGRTVISPNVGLCIAIAAVLVIFIASLLNKKLGQKTTGAVLTVFGAASVIANVVLSMRLEKILENAKKISISYGSVFVVIICLYIVVRGLYFLWSQKVLSTLDFMVLPGLMYFIINNYIPMVGIAIAFKKIDYRVGILKSPWVGIENFKVLFAHSGSFFQSDAFIITRNTLLYNLAFIVIGIISGVIVGICLADVFSKKLQKFFQTSILLPQLISMVIVAYIVFAFLSNETGMVNKMLGDKNSINFYSATKFWPGILVFVFTWKQIGYNAIIFLSSIVGIDKSLYEAARVDGAGRWKQIRFVTLPLLKPTIITLILLQVGRIFYSDFGLFYQVPMNSGALYSVTNTVDTYVYRSLMVLNNISVASAASTYQAIIGFTIVFVVNMVVRKLDKDNALF